VTNPGARGGDSRTASELNVRDGHEATKPRRVGGLERDEPIPSVATPCGAPQPAGFVRLGQAREGRLGEGRVTPVGGNTLEGEKPRRATRSISAQTAGVEVADSRAEQSPEGDVVVSARIGTLGRPSGRARGAPGRNPRDAETTRGQRRRRRRTAAREEKSSEGRNPMSGSGTKQGRQIRCGPKRQEVEKTWRRRRSGEANPTNPRAAAPGGETLKGRRTSWEESRRSNAPFGASRKVRPRELGGL
jgi:hypothetical protein